MGSKALAIFSVLLSAAPVFAADRVKRAVVPSAGGGVAVGVDPEVARYEATIKAVRAKMAAMKLAMQDLPIPKNSESGAVAAAAKSAAIVAGQAALMAEAKAAQDRLRNHIMGYEDKKISYGTTASAPNFEEKTDNSAMRPKEDRIMRGAAKGPSSAGGAASATSEFGTQGMADRPSLQKVSSRFGYNAGGGQIGAGFSTTMEPSSSQTMQINAGGATGQASAGTTSGAGGSGIGGSSTGGSDSKPSVNPTTGLSENKSDVEAKAYEREQERLKAIEERKAKQEEQEQQAKQQRMQMMAQMAQAGMQAASQAAQAAAQQDQGQGGGQQGALNALDQDVQALQQQNQQLTEQQKKQQAELDQLRQEAAARNQTAVTNGQPPPAP